MAFINKLLFISSLSIFSLYSDVSINLTDEKANQIGNLVWYNECKRDIDDLVAWNVGEDFASLGIGHFIWYPEGKKDIYDEMFPNLVEFFEEKQISLPNWLNSKTPCPWNSRAEFLSEKGSMRQKELTDLLSKTIGLQAQFMAKRINNFLAMKLKSLPAEEQSHIERCINRLIKEPNGYYVLIDYVNFKGDGLKQNEHYAGIRWGLVQVLKSMNVQSNQSPIQEFVKSAKFLLKQRVDNAPEAKNENRWITGWFKRLDSYTLQTKDSP